MTREGIPIWFWIIVAIGAVALVAIAVYVARRQAKTQRPE